jgi:hypothetical protein
MTWTFEKVDVEILDHKLLTANEKIILILCKRFENAPRGIRLSHKYFMERTGIKDYRTVLKCLDRLVLLGYFAFYQPQKNQPNQFTFKREEFQEYITQNLARRKSISKAMVAIRKRGVRQKAVGKNVVKLKICNSEPTKIP